ncbi:transcriptional regulator [Duganella sp. FT80W]|uniref:Transcriptional regulator n=1 Tax=Duganella guangzhouensis TaxID=2666084 RepID=A0A6I2LA13_9BURK|nr:transcriptional regulator [Duganella guangzhouensis]MRW94640.1 transcriptional regulator [Duganella guangzhouensis]
MELAGFEVGIVERIQREPAFAAALIEEVDEALTEGENSVAKGMLRVLTVGTIGFFALAQSLSVTAESLQQSLSQQATPDAASLRAVEKALRLALGVAAG